MSETKEMENNLALSWYEGIYTQSQAEWSAERHSLNFENVANEYARLYEKDAAATGSIEQFTFKDTLYGQV